jgi:chromosome segregation ATPase
MLLQELRDVYLQQEKTIATLQPHLLKLTELQCRLHSEQSAASAELDEARTEVAGVDESIAKLEALRAELSKQHKAYIQKGIDEVGKKFHIYSLRLSSTRHGLHARTLHYMLSCRAFQALKRLHAALFHR